MRLMRVLLIIACLRGSQSCALLVTNFDVDNRTLRQASEHLIPRGPDASSSARPSGFTIYHRLLHMHGLRPALQPYASTDGTRFAVFNGEIYNFREFERGTPFAADGESLLHAHERALHEHRGRSVGEVAARFVESLDGEFALVLLDLSAATLLLGTDPFATKPLFYALHAQRLAVATYKSALLRLGFPESTTVEVAANTAIVIDTRTARVISEERAVRWQLGQTEGDTRMWRAAFARAVEKRALHSGPSVPIALTLSNGLDSGLLHCVLDRLRVPLWTYSIVGGGDPIEKIAARVAWANSTMRAHAIVLSSADMSREEAWLQSHLDVYRFQYMLLPKHRAIPIHRDNAAKGISYIYRHARRRRRRLFLVGAGPDEHMSMYRPPTDYPALRPWPARGPLRTAPFPNRSTLEGYFPWPTFYGNSMLGLLRREEYIAGAYGIESRYPFLDKEVVQEWLRLSPVLKNGRFKPPIVDMLAEECHGYPHTVYKVGYHVTSNRRQASSFVGTFIREGATASPSGNVTDCVIDAWSAVQEAAVVAMQDRRRHTRGISG